MTFCRKFDTFPHYFDKKKSVVRHFVEKPAGLGCVVREPRRVRVYGKCMVREPRRVRVYGKGAPQG